MRCPAARSTRSLVASWSAEARVSWVEANYIGVTEGTPDDLDEEQWYHDNFGQVVYPSNSTYRLEGIEDADLDSIEAWDLTTGDPGVVMAVVDSGVDTTHPEFAGRIWTNENEDCTNGIDDDENGYVDDCHGWDAGEDDADPSVVDLPDDAVCARDHGTSVAGIMAANGNNGLDIAGMNWGSMVMPLKSASTSSTAGCEHFAADTVEAMFYAIDNGADVVNVSLSYPAQTSALWEAMAQEASKKGTIIVTSAGNAGTDVATYNRYPGLLDLDTLLVVANTTNRDELWAGANVPSNYGARVHIAAPGYVMRTIKPEPLRDVRRSLGTSFAAPLVAGTVGLVRSFVPELSSADTIRAVLEGADVLQNLHCAVSVRCVDGGRRLNARGALLRALELADLGVAVEITGVFAPTEDGVAEVDFEVMSTGTMALRGLQATLTLDETSGFGLQRGVTTLGDLGAGETVSADAMSATFQIAVPDACAGPTPVPVHIVVNDERGRSWSFDETLDVPCASIEPEPGPAVAPEPGGCDCRAESGAPRAGTVWLVVLCMLFVRRGKKR